MPTESQQPSSSPATLPAAPATSPAGAHAPPVTPADDDALTRRAVAAESRAAELSTQLQQATRTLDETRDALARAERKRQIERHLTAHSVIDLEAATLLTEASFAGIDNPDLPRVIADLKRSKPYLFRAPGAQRAGSMSSEVTPAPALDEAAHEARRTGDRRALLRYLRLRRGT